MAPGDRWGPFEDNLAPGERAGTPPGAAGHLAATVRVARAVAAAALLAAEARPDADPAACAAMMALEPIDRRRVLASYAALARCR